MSRGEGIYMTFRTSSPIAKPKSRQKEQKAKTMIYRNTFILGVSLFAVHFGRRCHVGRCSVGPHALLGRSGNTMRTSKLAITFAQVTTGN